MCNKISYLLHCLTLDKYGKIKTAGHKVKALDFRIICDTLCNLIKSTLALRNYIKLDKCIYTVIVNLFPVDNSGVTEDSTVSLALSDHILDIAYLLVTKNSKLLRGKTGIFFYVSE